MPLPSSLPTCVPISYPLQLTFWNEKGASWKGELTLIYPDKAADPCSHPSFQENLNESPIMVTVAALPLTGMLTSHGGGIPSHIALTGVNFSSFVGPNICSMLQGSHEDLHITLQTNPLDASGRVWGGFGQWSIQGGQSTSFTFMSDPITPPSE